MTMNYVVQPGDTIFSIASRFGVSVDDILRANGLTSPNFIFVGQTLRIPTPGPGGVPGLPGPGFPGIPGFPGAAINQRVDRLERQVQRLERELEQTNRRLDRLENRVRRLES
jgi:putative chitinase